MKPLKFFFTTFFENSVMELIKKHVLDVKSSDLSNLVYASDLFLLSFISPVSLSNRSLSSSFKYIVSIVLYYFSQCCPVAATRLMVSENNTQSMAETNKTLPRTTESPEIDSEPLSVPELVFSVLLILVVFGVMLYSLISLYKQRRDRRRAMRSSIEIVLSLTSSVESEREGFTILSTIFSELLSANRNVRPSIDHSPAYSSLDLRITDLADNPPSGIEIVVSLITNSSDDPPPPYHEAMTMSAMQNTTL